MTQPAITRRQMGFHDNPISAPDLAALEAWLAACRAEGLTERTDEVRAWHTVAMSRPLLLPAPHRADYPLGKGFFVWNLPNSAGGDPVRLVAKARAAGLGWVAFKCHDGTNLHSGDLTPWVTACRAADIDVWLWGYNYAIDPAGEATVAAARCEQFGARGYIINAEHEYKERGAAATTWGQTFKRLRPDVKLGLSSYRYPSLHRAFPFAEFAAVCDFHTPQVYWLLNTTPTTPTAQLARSIRELRAIRPLPVVPTGCAFPFQGWRPTVFQLDNFHQATITENCPGVAWWSFESAEAEPEFWNAIEAHQWPAG